MEINRADIPAQQACDVIQDNTGRITAVILNGTRYSPEALSALAGRVAELERARPVVAAAVAWRAADKAFCAFLDDAGSLDELNGGDDLDEACHKAEEALAGAVDAYTREG